MAGGMLVLLGMDSRIERPPVGGYLGTGMHGGVIYVRGEVEPWQRGKEVGTFAADEDDMATLMPLIEEYCEHFGMAAEEVLAGSSPRSCRSVIGRMGSSNSVSPRQAPSERYRFCPLTPEVASVR